MDFREMPIGSWLFFALSALSGLKFRGFADLGELPCSPGKVLLKCFILEITLVMTLLAHLNAGGGQAPVGRSANDWIFLVSD